MSQPYVGEIRMFGGNFAPRGWAFCDGQLLPVSENDALFSLIGTTYGGDGQNTFALPDLRGRIPIHAGNSHVAGEMSGTETVTLLSTQMPSHTHQFMGDEGGANEASPVNHVLARSNLVDAYIDRPPNLPMSANAVTTAGGSQPHENMQPYLAVSFIISLFGIYPSQT